MKNDGKAAERAFTGYWETVGHIERLRDMRDLMAINGGRRVADFAKPSDFIVSARGVPLHYAEVKSTTDGKCFAFGKIQDGQSKAALCEHARGCGAYKFYIFSYPLGQWFIMDCDLYAATVEAGRRSIKFEELPTWQK